ncbi:hypothetical protein GIB67_007500 [Kingdonia uniflora]|uniref:Uncharacterized protein n=1 Tax=Kingdonia uniflora TaxID=39325 RepID=A0A7J7LVW8_9MAGN|nr:hypothetical protein GIB67_007500 [Kingdonia uniflora]
MVLEEKIASEMQRLKLKYLGDHSLEMTIPAPIPPTYQGLSKEEAVEAEEDFYYKWRFYVFVLTCEERVVREKRDAAADSHSDTEESLLDEVAKEETELEFVLKGLGLSRKKRVDSRSNKVRKALSTKSMAGVDEGKKQKRMLKALPATATTGSGEVMKDKRRKVEPLRELGEKVSEGRSATVDDFKEVEERARLAVLHGEEDTSKMLQVETKANLDKMVKDRDRIGHHLMLKGYSVEEVNVIKADTYVEEENEENAEAVGIVDGLDGVYRQMVIDNQRDDVELPEGGSEKVELDSSRLREDDALMCNREFVEQFDRMKEANENREYQCVNAYFRLVELTQAVSDLTFQVEEKDSGIKKGLKELAEGHVQKGNANLRECQHKLDAALIREKVLEGEIKAKESLVMRKDELLKDIPAREKLNIKIGRLRAQKNEYARLESRLEKLRARFVTMVIPDTSRSDQLKAIVAYFVEEVKRLESE